MSRALTQFCLPLVVFGILLVRETVSYLVYLYPGEGLLWTMSFTMGHGLLPFQVLLDKLAEGYAGKLMLLGGLIALTAYGWTGNRRAVRFMICHVALIGVCTHAYLALGTVYGRSAGLEGSVGRLLVSLKTGDLVSLLLIVLLGWGCALLHREYSQQVRET